MVRKTGAVGRSWQAQKRPVPQYLGLGCFGDPIKYNSPLFRTATLLHELEISSIIWVEKMTMRSLLNSTSKFRKRMRSRGSKPAVGSSTTRIRGKWSSVWAIPIRCFIPPEKEPIFSCCLSSRCTAFKAFSTVCFLFSASKMSFNIAW